MQQQTNYRQQRRVSNTKQVLDLLRRYPSGITAQQIASQFCFRKQYAAGILKDLSVAGLAWKMGADPYYWFACSHVELAARIKAYLAAQQAVTDKPD